MFGILIVEDNDIFRGLLKETLTQQFPSVDIFEAVDGVEAIQKVETFLPDLIFMDLSLHGKNSFHVIRKIKAEYPNIIIAVLTAYNILEYEVAARQSKADYFLVKGISTQEDIVKLVESTLSARNLGAET